MRRKIEDFKEKTSKKIRLTNQSVYKEHSFYMLLPQLQGESKRHVFVSYLNHVLSAQSRNSIRISNDSDAHPRKVSDIY